MNTRRGQVLDTRFARWRKAQRSHPNGNECVEVAFSSDAVGVRDSKLGESSPVLAFTPTQWRRFLFDKANPHH